MQLQKVNSNPKQPSPKKCATTKKAIVKKDVKSTRNGCDGRLMAKILIQVN